MADNSENSAWNERYDGNRVPINDTPGSYGAPFMLFDKSSQTEWSEGSVNRAVKATYEANGGDASNNSNLDNGIATLKTMSSYVKIEMVYGVNGTARMSVPDASVQYRGYPTGVINNGSLQVDYFVSKGYNKTTSFIDPDGTDNASNTDPNHVYTSIRTIPKLKLSLPYEYILKFTCTSNFFESSVEYPEVFIKYNKNENIPSSYSFSFGGTYLPLPTDGSVVVCYDVTDIIKEPYLGIPSTSNNNPNRYPKAYETVNGLTSTFTFTCPNSDPFYDDNSEVFAIDWQSFMPTVGTFIAITPVVQSDGGYYIYFSYDNFPKQQLSTIQNVYPGTPIDISSNEKPVIRGNDPSYPTYLNYESGNAIVYFYMYDMNMGANRYDYNLLNPTQLSNYASNNVGGSSNNPAWNDLRASVAGRPYSGGIMNVYNDFGSFAFVLKMKQGVIMPSGEFEVGAYVRYKSTTLGIPDEYSTYSEVVSTGTGNRRSFGCTINPNGSGGSGGGGSNQGGSGGEPIE